MTVDAVAPAEVPLDFRQGSPFAFVLQFFQDEGETTPIDFTSWEFNMQIREGVADSAAPIIASLSSVSNSDQDRRIFLVPIASDGTPDLSGAEDPTAGAVCLKLTSAETSEIRMSKAPKKGAYPVEMTFYYDIEAKPPDGDPFRLAFGPITGTAEVTR